MLMTAPPPGRGTKSVLQNCCTLASRVERVITPDIRLGSPSTFSAVQAATTLGIKRERCSVSLVRHPSIFAQGDFHDHSPFRPSSEGHGSSGTVSAECPAPRHERGVRGERTEHYWPRVAKRGGGAGAGATGTEELLPTLHLQSAGRSGGNRTSLYWYSTMPRRLV
jgi:hypothetical protein